MHNHIIKTISYSPYVVIHCINPYRRKIQHMVDKFKNFVAEEIPKIFSDSDHEIHDDCGNYVSFLQQVRFHVI